MAGEVDNLVLEQLRHIRKGQDEMGEDIKMLILRIGAVERIPAGQGVSEVQQNYEIDRLRVRVD